MQNKTIKRFHEACCLDIVILEGNMNAEAIKVIIAANAYGPT